MKKNIKGMKQLEFIEILKGENIGTNGVGRGRGDRLKGRQCSVNQSKSYCVFCNVLIPELEPYEYVYLHKSKYAHRISFIANNCEGVRLNDCCGAKRIYSKEIATRLAKFFGKDEKEVFRVNISENISDNPAFSTFDITEEETK